MQALPDQPTGLAETQSAAVLATPADGVGQSGAAATPSGSVSPLRALEGCVGVGLPRHHPVHLGVRNLPLRLQRLPQVDEVEWAGDYDRLDAAGGDCSGADYGLAGTPHHSAQSRVRRQVPRGVLLRVVRPWCSWCLQSRWCARSSGTKAPGALPPGLLPCPPGPARDGTIRLAGISKRSTTDWIIFRVRASSIPPRPVTPTRRTDRSNAPARNPISPSSAESSSLPFAHPCHEQWRDIAGALP